jgi:hypothetical protein
LPSPAKSISDGKLPEPREWVWVDDDFDAGVDAVFAALFGNDSPFMERMRVLQSHTEVNIGQWIDGKRVGQYVIPKTTLHVMLFDE